MSVEAATPELYLERRRLYQDAVRSRANVMLGTLLGRVLSGSLSLLPRSIGYPHQGPERERLNKLERDLLGMMPSDVFEIRIDAINEFLGMMLSRTGSKPMIDMQASAYIDGPEDTLPEEEREIASVVALLVHAPNTRQQLWVSVVNYYVKYYGKNGKEKIYRRGEGVPVIAPALIATAGLSDPSPQIARYFPHKKSYSGWQSFDVFGEAGLDAQFGIQLG